MVYNSSSNCYNCILGHCTANTAVDCFQFTTVELLIAGSKQATDRHSRSRYWRVSAAAASADMSCTLLVVVRMSLATTLHAAFEATPVHQHSVRGLCRIPAGRLVQDRLCQFVERLFDVDVSLCGRLHESDPMLSRNLKTQCSEWVIENKNTKSFGRLKLLPISSLLTYLKRISNHPVYCLQHIVNNTLQLLLQLKA